MTSSVHFSQITGNEEALSIFTLDSFGDNWTLGKGSIYASSGGKKTLEGAHPLSSRQTEGSSWGNGGNAAPSAAPRAADKPSKGDGSGDITGRGKA